MLIDLVGKRYQGLFREEMHFGRGGFLAAFALKLHRIDQSDACDEDCLFVVLQVVFEARLSQDFPFAPNSGDNTSSQAAGSKEDSTASHTKAGQRSDPIEFCRRGGRAGKRCNGSSSGGHAETRDETGNTAHRYRTAKLGSNSVDE